MKKSIVIFVMLAAIWLMVAPSFTAMTVDWRVAPLPAGAFGNYRHLAYNPITGHLLLANTSTPQTVYILSALDGTTIGELAPPGGGYISLAPYGLGVDANGVIYATNDFYADVQILRWADETSVPTSVGATGATYVRALYLVGSGVNTKLIVPSQADETVRILGTSDGVNFYVEESFAAPDAVHAAIANPALTTVYVARGLSDTYYTHKWDKSLDVWSEDAGFTKSNWICGLAFSTRGNLYGAYWNTGTGVQDGIRVWNPTTGALIDSLDLGDTQEAARGGYISVYNAPNPLDDKLYFAFHGDVGYGAISIPTDPTIVVSPPSATVTIGQTKQFSYSGIPDPVVWSSTNTAVGSIDSTGLFSAISTGSCQVEATYSRGTSNWSGSADVTVIATSAPLAPDVVSNVKVYRKETFMVAPQATRSWELFE
ncbi:MAG: Ig-like domain-containing protein [bacterium]|nr:Ig-like domain-containing protein [bacterium]